MQKKIIKRTTICFLGFIVVSSVVFVPQLLTETTALTSFVPNLIFNHNFHEVVPGELYRSAEMPQDDLGDIINKYNIQTVIDVRKGLGGRYPEDGHPSEEQFLNSNGVKYLHAGLTGNRLPYFFEIERLLNAFNEAKPPILVHCTSGTHRSGVASTVWLSEFSKSSNPDLIAKQLSVEYGFFSLEREFKSYFQGFPTIDHMVSNFLEDKKKLGVDLRTWAWQNLSHDIPEYELQEEIAYNNMIAAKEAH
jgi:protein tyrosine phosphatase (PTP) superfamily phosphohydrolase (DUF442 family)